MATPVAAGFAALVLSHLSSKDFKIRGRGHEVKERLRYLASVSRHALTPGAFKRVLQGASADVVAWGDACTPANPSSGQQHHFKRLNFSCRNLASKGFSFWGENNETPNGALNWDLACGYFNSTNSSIFSDSFSLMGDSSPGDVDTYFPHGVASGSLQGVSVQFFKDANGQPPVFYASESPPVPDLTKVTKRAIDFQPASGGVLLP